ncbi:MAG: DUF1508 domain-containing protein [Halobacteriales archaeon]
MSNPSTGSSLSNVYEDRIGDASTEDEARGYWIFALGGILGIVGILAFLTSQRATAVRQWSIVLASAGLVLLIAGPIIRLPLKSIATRIVYAGALISAVAIVWFVVAYPAEWSPQTGNLAIIGLYAFGVLVVAASGAFVPVLTGREDSHAKVSALEAERDELREALEEAEADATDDEAEADATDDETEPAEEVAELRSDLEDAEARNDELQREVDQLHQNVADTEADEAELAALLADHQASESQFEVYQDRGGSWRWRLRHRDGDVIASSNEGHARQADAQQGVQAVRRDAPGATFLLIENEADLPDAASGDGFVFSDDDESQATFELYEDEAQEFRWRLRHENGNMIAHGGQGYASRDGAEHSVERIREYVGPAEYLQPDPTAIEVYRDEEGEFRWRLRYESGKILAGSGEGYASRSGARRAIDRIRAEVGDAEIEVYEDEDGGFRWRLAGGDGLIKADSGRYESRDGARDAVERVREFMPEADLIDIGEAAFEVYVDEGGEHRWRLRHRNGNTLASSGEGYASRSGVWDGIESVKRNAPGAEFEETDG